MDLMDYRRKIIANSPHLMSASGAVATFSDGADLPIKSLNVIIEPVQSGTGDPSPDNVRPISGWNGVKVTRCGKNLLTYVPNKIISPLLVTLDKSRATLVKKGVTYTMSFDMQNATTWRICAVAFDLEGNRYFDYEEYSLGTGIPSLGPNVSGQYYVWSSNYANKSFLITPIDDFYIMLFFLLGDTSESTVMVNPMLEVGSTATAYEPYNGVTIRSGGNLFNPHVYTGIAYNPTVGNTVTLADSAAQFTDNGNGVYTVTTSSTWRYFNIIIPIDPTKEYATKIVFNSTGQAGVTRGYLDADFKILTKFNSTDSAISWEYSLIPEANAAYYYFVFTNRGTASATLTLTQPQFVEGATVGDYDPYTDTFYGGTLNPLTGVLTVDRLGVPMESLTWYRSTSYANPIFYTTITGKASDYRKSACSILRNIGSSTIIAAKGFATQSANGDFASSDANAQIYARYDSATTVQEFVTAVTGQTIVYPLATPYEIQLTPHQIRSLYGNNTIFADTGNTSLEYWAHP